MYLRCSKMVRAVCCVIPFAALAVSASANTICVNTGGYGGCYAHIQAAVNAAAPGDVIRVSSGTYQAGSGDQQAGFACRIRGRSCGD